MWYALSGDNDHRHIHVTVYSETGVSFPNPFDSCLTMPHLDDVLFTLTDEEGFRVCGDSSAAVWLAASDTVSGCPVAAECCVLYGWLQGVVAEVQSMECDLSTDAVAALLDTAGEAAFSYEITSAFLPPLPSLT